MKILLYMNYIATVISNISNGYIHLYWTGPPTLASNGTCMGNILLNSANKEILSILSVPVIRWQETTMAVKKRSFSFVC